MNVLAVALADDTQRFIKGYAPKGARLFLRPNLEVMRIAALLRPGDRLRYLDERVESAEQPDHDLCLVHIGLGQRDRGRELLHNWTTGAGTPVFFGPQVTSWREAAPAWARPRVVGDITNIWPQLRADAESGRLRPVYVATEIPGYTSPRQVGVNFEMDSAGQTIQFARGCFCPEPVRRLCTEHLYYGRNRMMRSPEEIVGEVITLPGKRIQLLDDDVAAAPDYYQELFTRLRDHRRQWIVNASERLFEQPRLIRLLSKAGTKIVYLDESFLLGKLRRAADSHRLTHQLYRRVKSLQANKMLVGARLVMPLEPSTPPDYDRIATLLRQIDLDFIEPRFLRPDGSLAQVVYRPTITSAEPAWLKYRFYSMGTIADRMLRRPRRVGFFTTAVYLLPYSAAYRQNLLEELP
ncbi:hypothetical protein FJY68_02280 [candidate division WOR-3 bacterium]|uniref:Radical SAM protein n=1 Tax=candidate division WOR-3 bacterium TaxID=2052148 RepID=A0A937XE78_UNCW3|nr:hypothetical protein [candidate division WOR-3 bacterium]